MTEPAQSGTKCNLCGERFVTLWTKEILIFGCPNCSRIEFDKGTMVVLNKAWI